MQLRGRGGVTGTRAAGRRGRRRGGAWAPRPGDGAGAGRRGMAQRRERGSVGVDAGPGAPRWAPGGRVMGRGRGAAARRDGAGAPGLGRPGGRRAVLRRGGAGAGAPRHGTTGRGRAGHRGTARRRARRRGEAGAGAGAARQAMGRLGDGTVAGWCGWLRGGAGAWASSGPGGVHAVRGAGVRGSGTATRVSVEAERRRGGDLAWRQWMSEENV